MARGGVAGATNADRSATHTNAYAADGRADNFAVNAASGIDPANYSDTASPRGAGNNFYYPDPGWAPILTRDDYGNTPDPTRLEELPRVDRRPNLRDPWGWWRALDRDRDTREAVTEQLAAGWAEQKGASSRAPDPRWSPPPEPRPTSALSPRRYSFMRPFAKDAAWLFDGSHFSMADNRRAYDILTMAPVPHRRNTYRVEPSPWDTDIVDMSGTDQSRPDERLIVPEIPLAATQRPYRAG